MLSYDVKSTTPAGPTQGTCPDQLHAGNFRRSEEKLSERRTDSFEAAVLKAANLGDNTDTTAAICGQIAGAFYGSGIPKKWLERLVMQQEISTLADRLFEAKR